MSLELFLKFDLIFRDLCIKEVIEFYLWYLVYQGSLNFIIYVYFMILKELKIYVNYCSFSINNNLLVVKCYPSLVVSGFLRNEFNSYTFINLFCLFI